MLSSGTDLRPGLDSRTICPLTAMPESMGVEEHLLRILDAIAEFEPQHMIVDAVSAARRMGSERSAFEFLVRLINASRERGITLLMLNQTVGEELALQVAGEQLSSLVDTIVFLRYIESAGETNRVVSIVKSRGRNHSNQIREFRITDHGVEVAEIYSGDGGVLTGAARQEKEARDAVELRHMEALIEAKQREIERRKAESRAEEARFAAAVEQAEIELRNLEIERDKARDSRQARVVMRTGPEDEPIPLTTEDNW